MTGHCIPPDSISYQSGFCAEIVALKVDIDIVTSRSFAEAVLKMTRTFELMLLAWGLFEITILFLFIKIIICGIRYVKVKCNLRCQSQLICSKCVYLVIIIQVSKYYFQHQETSILLLSD